MRGNDKTTLSLRGDALLVALLPATGIIVCENCTCRQDGKAGKLTSASYAAESLSADVMFH